MNEIDLYNQSGHAGAMVPPPSRLLVALFERRTGRRFDAALWAEYERVRAYTGYYGVAPNHHPPASERVQTGGMLADPTDLGE